MYVQKTKWSVGSIVVTSFVVLLFLGIGAFLMLMGLCLSGWLIWLALIALSACSMLFMPISVSTTGVCLCIKFPFRQKCIPLETIRLARPFSIKSANMLRTCGSGAFFGWWGWYYSKATGKVMMYASNLDNLLLVSLGKGKKYVISCADADALTEQIIKEQSRL